MTSKSLIQFTSGAFTLAGTWDLPEAKDNGAFPAVIFCHGFTGNRFESRRLYVRLANQLATTGIASFRFDHRGCGESTGDFLDFTPSGLLCDLEAALEVFLETPHIDPARVAVVGYSLGGASAGYLTTLYPKFKTAALWAAVAKPEIIKDRLATYPGFLEYKDKGYFDYFGYRVSRDYIDTIGSSLKPLEWIKSFPSPLLAVQGLNDPIVKPEQLELYREVRSHPEDHFMTVQNADHGFTTADNGDLVVAETCRWLQRYLIG
jgi:predicted alpha/beta-fold hydrolase